VSWIEIAEGKAIDIFFMCESDDKHSGFIKDRKFLDQL
jgi:hypothetical protein